MTAIHNRSHVGQNDLAKMRPVVDTSKRPPPYPFRVPRVIRHHAKSLAEVFWEGFQLYSAPEAASQDHPVTLPFELHRSVWFRRAWPDRGLYVLWQWPQFVKVARSELIAMLGMPGVHENIKQPIYKALLEQQDDIILDPVTRSAIYLTET